MTPMDLYNFFDSQPENNNELMNLGFLPWWTDPEIKLAFWRPISSFIHFLEFRFLNNQIWVMHLNSILLYGFLVWLAAILYHRLSKVPLVIILAAFLFAVHDTNAGPVAWIANRNTLLSMIFGLITLWAYDRWRQDQWKIGIYISVGTLLLSLLSSESGIATCAYLFAYSIFLDRERYPKSMISLLPYVVLVVVWRIIWTMQDYGIANTSLYTDPFNEPVIFLFSFIEKFPVFFYSQWLLPSAEFSMFLEREEQFIFWIVAVVSMFFIVTIIWPVLRQSKTAAFFFTGMSLSIVPLCAAHLHDRLLLFVGFGAMGLIAEIFRAILKNPIDLWTKKFLRNTAIGLASLLAIIHLVISPIFLTMRTILEYRAEGVEFLGMMHMPLDDDVKDKDFIVLNPLEPYAISSGFVMREAKNMNRPRTMRVLAPGHKGMTVKRNDKYSLLVRPNKGFYSGSFNRMASNQQRKLHIGDRIKLGGMTVEVTEVDEKNHPIEARFVFDVPLEDSSLVWVQWKMYKYVTFKPPPIGTTLEL